MKLAVVGGTGNISTSIVARLLADGHDVTCVTRGISGRAPDAARVIECDRRDTERFESMMQRQRFDGAIDMICFTSEDAASSIRAFRGVGHFIHTSTVRTYGIDPDWLPISEDHQIRPVVPYGIMKARADSQFLAAYHSVGFPVTIIKPSTTYGPKRIVRQLGLDTGWITRIRRGKPILVVDDGRALHHFLHVDDAARAFTGVLGKERCIGQIYNVVNPDATTWLAYHHEAMKILGREVNQVGISTSLLSAIDQERFAMAIGVFALNLLYSSDKIRRDVPEFTVEHDIHAGLLSCIEHLDRTGPQQDAEADEWEDRVVAVLRSLASDERLRRQ
jgi:nucleoside-diphosphate-sugar epimerase